MLNNLNYFILIFSLNYLLINFPKKISKEISKEISKDIFYQNVVLNSTIHCIISSLMVLLFLFNFINESIFKISIIYDIAYFMYDSYLYIFEKIPIKDRNIMLFHHSMLFLAAYFGFSDCYYYARCLLCEISTIFLNLRWLAYKKIYFKNELLYSCALYISFIICRIINISLLVYEFYYKKLMLYLVICMLFLILNIYWTYLLTLKGITMYQKNFLEKKTF